MSSAGKARLDSMTASTYATIARLASTEAASSRGELSGSMVFVMASDQVRSSPASPVGIPSISEMIWSGKTAANWSMTSTESHASSDESKRSTTSSVRSRHAAMAFGVKARVTRRRSRAWSSPSRRCIIRWPTPPAATSRALSRVEDRGRYRVVDPHGQGPIAREAVDVAVTGEDVRAGHPVEVDRLVPAKSRVLPIGIREVAGSERVEGDRDRAAADRPERRDRRRSLVTGGPGGPGRPHGELVRDPQPDRQLAEEREGDVRGLGEQLEEPGAVHLLDHHVGAGGDGGVAGLPVEEGELADRFAGADGGHVQTADGDLGGPVDDDPPPVGDLSLAAEHRALGDLATPVTATDSRSRSWAEQLSNRVSSESSLTPVPTWRPLTPDVVAI